MSQPISPSVLQREAEGIGRLNAVGYGPGHDLILGLPGRGIPPRQPVSSPTCWLEDEWLTVSQLANALCVRVKTIRDYLQEADLIPISISEAQQQLREAVEQRKTGEISEDEYNDLVDDLLHSQANEDPQLVDCEALALWVFTRGKHRIQHRWAWWWIESVLGTWTVEGGYIDAMPVTRREWREIYSEKGLSKHK